jgi:hypothetical protein
MGILLDHADMPEADVLAHVVKFAKASGMVPNMVDGSQLVVVARKVRCDTLAMATRGSIAGAG